MNETERTRWLEARRKGVGSSDAPKICFGQALLVYLDKIGQLPPSDSPPMRWGRKLEDTVAEAYREETGAVTFAPDQASIVHPQYPWMFASLDRVAQRDGKEVVLECKTARYDDEWGEPGTDQIPDAYNLQVQHQMACVELDEADVAVLISGSDFRVYKVQRQDSLIDKLVRIEEDFWQRVVNRCPPTPDWEHPDTLDVIRNLYGITSGRSIQLGEEASQLLAAWQQWKERKNTAAQEVDRYRAQLEWLMGEAEVACLPCGRMLVRKESVVKEHTRKESRRRLLEVKEPKGPIVKE